MSHIRASLIAVTILTPLTLSHPASAEDLLYQQHFTKLGAFRVPDSGLGSGTHANFDGFYSGQALSFNPDGNGESGSLFLAGHLGLMVAEISIPALVNSTSTGSLNRSRIVQPFGDPMDGKLGSISPGGGSTNIGGTWFSNLGLMSTGYVYYDGTSAATGSHFISGPSLSTGGDTQGPSRIGSLNPGYVGGYIAQVPDSKRGDLGGMDLFSGQSGLSVLGRTSLGPAAVAFHSMDVGITNASGLPLVYYPLNHATLGVAGSTVTTATCNPPLTHVCFSGTTDEAPLSAVAIPGTKTVLFIYSIGFGDSCYKGASPCDNSQGYGVIGGDRGTLVLAYSWDDLISVAHGSKNPWDILPYAAWRLDTGFSKKVRGAAYDPTQQILYVSVYSSDTNGSPVIVAYKVTLTGVDLPPNAPRGLRTR